MPTITVNLPDTIFVSSAQPDTNLSYYPLLYAGTDPSFETCIGLIQISLPSLPVPSVVSAMLQLAVVVKSGANPSQIVVNRVSDSYDIKAVTYHSRPAFMTTASQYDIQTSDLYTSIQIDITELVNGWLDGTYANNGLALTNSDGISIVQFGTDKIVYEPYFPRLILTYSSTPVPTASPYGMIYNTGNQTIAAANSVAMDHNGPMSEITHQIGSEQITITKEGLYSVWFSVFGQTANQFVLYQNEAVLLSSIYGTSTGANYGTTTINAAAGDIISLRNCTDSSVTLSNAVGGTKKNVSASILLLKAGQTVQPDPALAGVNAAQDNIQMDDAIRDPVLGLDLTGYVVLDIGAKSQVQSGLLVNKPTLGYLTVPDLQDMLDYEVALVQTVVDPNNIFVLAGATGGNGSSTKPFGTIPDGISAVNPGGTVHILAGDYPITANIAVNKNGITLSGEPGNRLLQTKAQITPLFISGSNVTLRNLNLTSDIAYLGALIEVAANGMMLLNNNIYGPPNPSTVNRGILLDNNRTGIIIENNYIHSLVQGISIASGVQGNVNNNHIEGTQTGILVSSGSMSFMGNYWDGTKNTYDIGLMSSIAGNYQVDELSANNYNAKVQIF